MKRNASDHGRRLTRMADAGIGLSITRAHVGSIRAVVDRYSRLQSEVSRWR